MISLFLKEISGFFSSITGYIIVIVFLIINGLFMWVFPGELNIIDSGYASINTLFFIAPWIFLFLIPAITMKSFSEEIKTGNMEMLLTRPVTDLQIVMAKYMAAFILSVIAIAPTLICFLSVSMLANPAGNIDAAGTWGSYLGLLFLAAAYISIGVFASSLTENTVVAFILAVVICFFLYKGFNSVAYLSHTGIAGNIIINLGIDAHYKSMQRGVIDSRDLIYFLSVSVLFIMLTRVKLSSRNW